MDHGHRHGSSDRPSADASVRLATPADAEAVGRVQAAVWHDAYRGVLPPDVLEAARPQAFAAAWAATLADAPSPAYWMLVACAGPDVVGFAAAGPSPDPDSSAGSVELLVGGVDPQARHQGHGSRLLNATVDTALEQGFIRVRGWLLEQDAGTRAFLEAAGFALDGARRERVVGSGGGAGGDSEAPDTVVEVRLTTALAQDDGG